MERKSELTKALLGEKFKELGAKKMGIRDSLVVLFRSVTAAMMH